MGTRSLTYVYDGRDTKNTQALMCAYQQFDGYPSGVGQRLADFAKSFTIVNGIGGDAEIGKTANGAGCFAAQLVARFKKHVGGFYLCTTEQDPDYGQEYEYHLFVQEGVPVQIKCYDRAYSGGKTLIIDCEAGEWDAKLAEYETANKDD